jgi:hypothetical protein
MRPEFGIAKQWLICFHNQYINQSPLNLKPKTYRKQEISYDLKIKKAPLIPFYPYNLSF